MTYCIIKCYTNDENIEPQADWGFFKITKGLVEKLEKYNIAVQAMTLKPFRTEFLNCAIRYRSYPSVDDPELEEYLIKLVDSLESEYFIIMKDLPNDLKEYIESEDNSVKTYSGIVRFYGLEPGNIEWMAYLRNKDKDA